MSDNKITKDIVIFYHGSCTDGFCGALAAWKKFGDRADYVPIHPEGAPPDDLSGKEIYTIDMVFKRKYLDLIIQKNKRITAIDHHITNQESAKLTQDYSFDLSHSGAVLAWQYFHPQEKLPKLFIYVEDSDLGRWNLPLTKEILSSLDLFDFDFKTWDKLINEIEDEDKLKDHIEKGSIILKYQDIVVDRIIKSNAQLVEFEGYEIYALNAPRIFRSIAGMKLAELKPPFAIVWYQDKKAMNVSLRRSGDIDLSEIAKKYGGGGHPVAAGFRMDIDIPFPWKVIKNKNE